MIYRDETHRLWVKTPWYFIVFCVMLCIPFIKPEMAQASSIGHYQITDTEDEEQSKYMIDINVSIMNETVIPDYEDVSNFKISLTNSGTESLTNFEVSLTQPDIYEMFYIEKDVWYRLFPNETNSDETEKTLDETITLSDTLAPNDTVTVYVVDLSKYKASSDQVDGEFAVYTKETGQHTIPLTLIQEEKQDDEEQDPNQPTNNRVNNSDVPSEETTEPNTDEKDETTEIELDKETEAGSQNQNALKKDLVSEIDNNDNNKSDNFICEVTRIERTKGYYINNIFFSTRDSQYMVHFSPESSLKELNYQIGAYTNTVSVKDSLAVIEVPDNISNNLEIYYFDENQNKVIICNEHIINENTAPTVHYEKIEKDGKSYALVTVEDYGNIISGLMDCSVYMDGELINISESSVLKKVNLFDEYEVASSRQYTILLENGNTHNFEVIAKDYAGNIIKEKFSFEQTEKEIVNVVLPTSFNIFVLPDDQGNQLYGENIVLCNKSGFPVQVDVSSTQVQIDRTIPNNSIYTQMNPNIFNSIQNKNFDLSLQLLQANKLVKTIELPEGNAENVTSFVLSEENPLTDFETLQNSEVNEVNSPDYAVLNIRGTMDQNMKYCSKNNDLHVKLVFRFNKLDEID